jgi:hypothetical protein
MRTTMAAVGVAAARTTPTTNRKTLLCCNKQFAFGFRHTHTHTHSLSLLSSLFRPTHSDRLSISCNDMIRRPTIRVEDLGPYAQSDELEPTEWTITPKESTQDISALSRSLSKIRCARASRNLVLRRERGRKRGRVL